LNLDKKSAVSDLKPGQQATLFPSLGYFDAKRNSWRALIHGRVFIDGRTPLGTRILLRGLKKAMRATPEDVASETFQARIDGFLAAPGRRRRIVVGILGHHYQLRRRTRRNGAFFGALTLPAEFAAADGTLSTCPQTLAMELLRSTDDLGTIAPTSGIVHVVSPHGLSVISDIDDTIKLTEATSRREMLANTFLRPFEVVEGMSQVYQNWKSLGCDFHYVSSSPWQLYEPLSELCLTSQFPAGSMHLRYFRVRDEMFKRFRPIRRNSKVGIIAGILKLLPNRRFVLVGDSGEKDPEIYRFLAKRYPRRIAAILIRNMVSRPLDSRRTRKLTSLPDSVLVRIFDRPEQIQDVVDRVR
jgi:phosphatidate phosphatase APP1